MSLQIIKVGDFNQSVLFKQCDPVRDFNFRIRGLLDNMREAMEANGGKGLAAPQVGINLRAIVLGDGSCTEMINPRIVNAKGKEKRAEGCLSLPGLSVDVERYTKITVAAQDGFGNKFTYSARGPVARLIQHEIDHLDGVLISKYQ